MIDKKLVALVVALMLPLIAFAVWWQVSVWGECLQSQTFSFCWYVLR